MNNQVVQKKVECRGCGKQLISRSYDHPYDPETGESARTNFFGGFVCSRACDVQACLSMQSSMPGAGIAKHLNTPEREQVERNWGEA